MVKCIIIQSSNQINSQYKSSSAIPIPLCQNAKDFQMPNDVFYHHPLFCQLFVELLLFFCQFAAFRFLYRYPRIFVQIKQSLITTIGKAFNLIGQCGFAVFVKRKIVSRSFGKPRVNDLFGLFASPHLCFYRVPLFLARIISLLFFFGRSIGDSTTSTTTTSISGDKSGRRLPGKVNSLDARQNIFDPGNNARNRRFRNAPAG